MRRAVFGLFAHATRMNTPPKQPPAPSEPRKGALRSPMAWALLPLALALVYAGVRAIVGQHPSLEAMVPSDAIVVWRWKDFATFDAAGLDAPEPGRTVATPSASLGSDLNIPGLPGVDRNRELVRALLPPDGRSEPWLVVLPVANGAKMRATFRDPNLKERHARHLEIHGAWAASCSDRLVARDAGTFSGRLAAPEGEDWSVSAEWPAFVDFVVRPEQASNEPFSSGLAALGFDPQSAEETAGPGGERQMTVKAGRVPLVRDAWTRVTLRSFPGRVTLDLEPSEGAKELRQALASLEANPDDDREATMPSPVEASLHLRGVQGRRVLVYATGYAGLKWPAASAANEFKPLRLSEKGGLTLWAELADGPAPAWMIGLAGPKAAFPDLATLGPLSPADAQPAAYSAGGATLTTLYGSPAEPTTFLPVPTAADADWLVTAIGPRADMARAALVATTTTHARTSPTDTPDRIELATFTVAKVAFQRLVGSSALGPKGLFATLADRNVKGRLLALDHVRLRLEIEADAH